MTGVAAPIPILQFFDNNGNPNVGGSVLFTVGGVPTAVYQDVALTIPLPFTGVNGGVPLNSRGEISNASGLSQQLFLTPNVAYVATVFDANGNQLNQAAYVDGVQFVLSQSVIGAVLWPQTAAEITAGVVPNTAYPYDNLLRYFVPNNSGVAAQNTTNAQLLWNPTTGIAGSYYFPNTTGADIYYFSGLIGIHDGVDIDLGGVNLTLTMVGSSADSQAGFITAIRNFSMCNGSITIIYTYVAGTNTGNAFMFGGRGTDNPLFPPIYDSLLPSPMGNISLKDISIVSNAGGGEGRAIFHLGGLINVVIENVTVDGQSALLNGIYGEYGWATNESSEYLRQTSHPNNWQIRNFVCRNVTATGVQMNGGYNITVDGLKVYDSAGIVAFGMGEACFYRPWADNDGAGSKHGIVVRNAVGGGITGLGFSCTGSTTLAAVNASYLGGPGHNNPNSMTDVNFVDLLDFTIEDCSAVGTVGSYGIECTGSRLTAKRNTLRGFQRGIVTSQECTNFTIEQNNILDSTGIGVAIGQAVNTVYSPARQSTGSLTGNFIAGSGTAGASAAISVSTTTSCKISVNRFGYELIHDGVVETTQLQAVNAGTDAFGIVCDDNYVAATSGGAVAYALAAATTSRGCTILNDRYGAVWITAGGVKSSGIWENTLNTISADNGDSDAAYVPHTEARIQLFGTTLTTNRTLTLSTTNANLSDECEVLRTGLGSYTLSFGGLKTLPSGTAAWAKAIFNGTAWVLTAYGTL